MSLCAFLPEQVAHTTARHKAHSFALRWSPNFWPQEKQLHWQWQSRQIASKQIGHWLARRMLTCRVLWHTTQPVQKSVMYCIRARRAGDCRHQRICEGQSSAWQSSEQYPATSQFKHRSRGAPSGAEIFPHGQAGGTGTKPGKSRASSPRQAVCVPSARVCFNT
jgi:hypothetical protein